MVEIEIDGKPHSVEQGAMIIEVTDALGIPVPRFCYHKKLSIAANCRMCLVQVENAPKPLPACATPVTDGMKIYTKSPQAIKAQQAVMEFLLINHPLDCPICDQGGQCELQDVALGYGQSYSEFAEGKRAVADPDIGPLISTGMTRCIHCTRCVRFGEEVAGHRELGATSRGEHMEIGTYIQKSVASEVSGNVIDLCPVGALTSKPFRFKARSWEMMARPSISPHDCLGSNIYYHTRRDKILRAVPKENEAINEIWLSDRDRFSYEGLYQNRLTKPMIKKQGAWQPIEWEAALTYAVEQLQTIHQQKGPEWIGALVNPSVSLEEGYLLQKLLRSKEIHNIDYRLKQQCFTHQDAQSMPQLGVPFEKIETADQVFLIGCDIRMEAPLLAVRMRKAMKQGSVCSEINPTAFEHFFPVAQTVIAKQGDFVTPLLSLVKALQSQQAQTVALSPVAQQAVNEIQPDEKMNALAERMLQGEHKHIILGAYATQSPQADWVAYLAGVVAKMTKATIGELSLGANSAGCWLSGVTPHKSAFQDKSTSGKTVKQMLSDEALAAYCFVNIDPDYDFADSLEAKQAFNQAQFVVACSSFDTPGIREHADLILPMCPHTETRGTFINAQGDWQSFSVVATPLGESKPLWKILRVLANFWHIEDMGYDTLDEVMTEIKERFDANSHQQTDWLGISLKPLEKQQHKLTRLSPMPIYANDILVRQSPSLQATVLAQTDKIHINPQTATQLQIALNDWVTVEQEGQHSQPLQVEFDAQLDAQTVLVPMNIAATQNLGAGFREVNLHKSKGTP